MAVKYISSINIFSVPLSLLFTIYWIKLTRYENEIWVSSKIYWLIVKKFYKGVGAPSKTNIILNKFQNELIISNILAACVNISPLFSHYLFVHLKLSHSLLFSNFKPVK